MDMDSTPIQTVPNLKSKLPIKRKTIPPSSSQSPPPFKFHRIWTQQDEIAFLNGLLHSGLLFPRDLNLFYHRFSTSISHPYSHSQLSEKLRRLRKKFRSFSSRQGHNALSNLSPHDRALYQLSEKLWSPQFASTSPFRNAIASPKIKAEEEMVVEDDAVSANPNNRMIDGDFSTIALDVFDRCMKEAKVGLFWQQGGFVESFGKRWQEQRALEFDVFARRLRLVIENSLNG